MSILDEHLALETGNTAERQTELIATGHDLGGDHLEDFVGNHILEVKSGTSLLGSADRPGRNNFGGVFGRGVGAGVGMHGVSTRGDGVRGEGENGVVGISSTTGHSGVSGKHTGQGYGVVGDGSGASNARRRHGGGRGDGGERFLRWRPRA
jgi:hypothetical protein